MLGFARDKRYTWGKEARKGRKREHHVLEEGEENTPVQWSKLDW